MSTLSRTSSQSKPTPPQNPLQQTDGYKQLTDLTRRVLDNSPSILKERVPEVMAIESSRIHNLNKNVMDRLDERTNTQMAKIDRYFQFL